MKRVVYTSPFVPAEFIAAHGCRPDRVLPTFGKGLRGSAEGMCPYALAFVNEVCGRSRVDSVVLTTTCDQMRRAADLIAGRSNVPIFLMNVPATWQTAMSRGLYRSELERLGRFLVGLGGKAPSLKRLSNVMAQARSDCSGPASCSANSTFVPTKAPALPVRSPKRRQALGDEAEGLRPAALQKITQGTPRRSCHAPPRKR